MPGREREGESKRTKHKAKAKKKPTQRLTTRKEKRASDQKGQWQAHDRGNKLKSAAGAIDQAGATNRRLWRGQALDKCIYCFTILCLLGGLGFLVWKKFLSR